MAKSSIGERLTSATISRKRNRTAGKGKLIATLEGVRENIEVAVIKKNTR